MIGKYDRDGPFNDPILRCCDCQSLVFRDSIKTHGSCPKCANRRLRNVLSLSEEEMAALKEKNIDPEFLGLYEGVDRDEGLVM